MTHTHSTYLNPQGLWLPSSLCLLDHKVCHKPVIHSIHFHFVTCPSSLHPFPPGFRVHGAPEPPPPALSPPHTRVLTSSPVSITWLTALATTPLPPSFPPVLLTLTFIDCSSASSTQLANADCPQSSFLGPPDRYSLPEDACLGPELHCCPCTVYTLTSQFLLPGQTSCKLSSSQKTTPGLRLSLHSGCPPHRQVSTFMHCSGTLLLPVSATPPPQPRLSPGLGNGFLPGLPYIHSIPSNPFFTIRLD